MVLIAHLSDLHFGAASVRAVEALLDSLTVKAPDLIVITGDLTQEGRKKEFEEAGAFLEKLPTKAFVIPGNHDLPVRNLIARFMSPYARFEHYINHDISPVYSDSHIKLIGLNSARRAAVDINWSYGRLSKPQIESVAEQLKVAPAQTIKAVALHHPFIRGPGKAGARTVGRASEALDAFARNGLDMALSGHVHHSKADILTVGDRNIVLVQAGTATSVRTRHEAPAYNLIRADRHNIEVTVLSLAAQGFETTVQACFRFDGDAGWVPKNT